MKTLIYSAIIFLLWFLQPYAQPLPTIKTKIQKPLAGVTYIVYADVKPTNTSSVLVEDLNIEITDVTSYIKTLTNVIVSGDTTFGEFTIPTSANIQYVKCGVVATSLNKKPSLMKVSTWLAISPRETKPTFLIIEEK